ncbi:MAG: Gfo/Idh/MocA family oxidoreductase [Bacteroidales bacterium]
MNKPVRILFSAISGYGYYYLKSFFEDIPSGQATIAGVIDPSPERSGYYADIRNLNCPIYPAIDQFFAAGHLADLTVISSPIHFHAPQAVSALINGSNVLVDKPLCGSVNEAEELIRVKNETGRQVEVGYQWSFSRAIGHLKLDLLSGFYGKPLRMKTICLWPRDYAYYQRNNWAGKILSADGRPVLDSPANNACAHFLHNMFYLLAPGTEPGEPSLEVSAERYRAYDIDNYDTVSARCLLKGGAELFFHFSHVTETLRNPEFMIECESGTIHFGGRYKEITGLRSDGTAKQYGAPDDTPQFHKLQVAIESVWHRRPAVCSPEIALYQTRCIEALQQSTGEICNFPDDRIVKLPERRFVKGLDNVLARAYEGWEA